MVHQQVMPAPKKEPASRPENWRAISLLSHMRKIIEKILDSEMSNQYTFPKSQCEFKEAHSIYTALLRMLRATRTGCKVFAVLDFKQTYASVPRCDAVQRLRSTFHSRLASMLESMLYQTRVSTIGNSSNFVGSLARGLSEGSPISPTICNVFIDSLAANLRRTANDRMEIPVN